MYHGDTLAVAVEVVEALDAIEVVVGVGVIVPLVVPPEPFVTIMNQQKDIVQCKSDSHCAYTQ